MTPEEIENTVAQLTTLNERELIEVLSRVFDVFAQRFDGLGINPYFGDRYALLRSSFVAEESDEPFSQVLCLPSEPYLLKPHDDAIESGRCPTCGTLVACTDKLATCAVCGTKRVECT